MGLGKCQRDRRACERRDDGCACGQGRCEPVGRLHATSGVAARGHRECRSNPWLPVIERFSRSCEAGKENPLNKIQEQALANTLKLESRCDSYQIMAKHVTIRTSQTISANHGRRLTQKHEDTS